MRNGEIKVRAEYDISEPNKSDTFEPDSFAGCSCKAELEFKLIAEFDELVEFSVTLNNDDLDVMWAAVEEIRKGGAE